MKKIIDAAYKHKQLILDAERFVWQHPETGYKEFETSKYMENAFESLGYEIVKAGDIPGFYTVIDTGKKGPEVLILGELDSIICPEHPESNPQTGAVHSCGHNAQCASLLGVAAILKEDGILDNMCGRIRLCAVPAEELLEIEFRSELMKKGTIKYFGGKPEFLSRGYFDGVDMAIMVHTSSATFVNKGSVGCVAKKITYKGKAAHAGGAPWDGINALYAANCGINAVNAIRETFKENDIIRFHPIVTSAGTMVNAIPYEARIESYVRGKSFDAIVNANRKVNRALIGGALSIGANVDIDDRAGYAPLYNDDELLAISVEAGEYFPEHGYKIKDAFSSGSTDMGDLSVIMPSIMPYFKGSVGTDHGKDYYIENPIAACVDCAAFQVIMLEILLSNGGARAKKVVENFKPLFSSKEEYLKFMDNLSSSGDRIEYSENEVKIIL